MLSIKEEFKDIEEVEGYMISNLGRVYSKISDKFLKTFINNSGYECIRLGKRKDKKSFTIHRLVAKYFIPNTNTNKTEVNHKDGIKTHNYMTNLEWITSSENKKHAFKKGLRTKESCISTLGKKHLPKTTSKYHNVSFDKSRNKWVAVVRHNGKNLEQKRFNTEEEAAMHVNYIIDKYKLNRPKNILL